MIPGRTPRPQPNRRSDDQPNIRAGHAYGVVVGLPAGGKPRRVLVAMKASRAAARRHLPGSPFGAPAPAPPAETFTVCDQVTHDTYGLGVANAVFLKNAPLIDKWNREGLINSKVDYGTAKNAWLHQNAAF